MLVNKTTVDNYIITANGTQIEKTENNGWKKSYAVGALTTT